MAIKTIEIDCSKMISREAAHAYLMEVLCLPTYYGKNLDALYDCLRESPACRIRLLNAAALSALGAYGRSLLDVFRDVAAETSRIELIEA